ncbi:hypothetical protein N7E81_10165 [Reichenbachiella carrageenanivorans]|uniref:Contractile injection system tube protein N-terminal domain-containing protein n=1 Tax=Reichenbachiella carrageenanivorans TaxID=2979869 RepID=A0ABY6CY58_9BACT|nr:hypothetical protein [Reichenbachiella carrageenanivorans]UXX77733.1 hypothetical protein N7E81_10165 [Reichenbachiella carrageenanivorans]
MQNTGNSDSLQTKVKFIAYSDEKGKEKKGTPYEVKINPASISHNKSIAYTTEEQVKGSIDRTHAFKHINAETISLEIVIDGTGAGGALNVVEDVSEEIKKLEEVVYHYDGEMHETNYVGIVWGDLMFFGRLTNLDFAHTLFKPSGQPLRTKVKMSFVSSKGMSAQALEMNVSSPDLSHLVTVTIGDTLPLMCQRIYKSSQYYLQVARLNGLTDFRNLEPGRQLLFPPIKK